MTCGSIGGAAVLSKLRPGRHFVRRRVLPAGIGLVLGWLLAAYVTGEPSPPETPPAATQPADDGAIDEAGDA